MKFLLQVIAYILLFTAGMIWVVVMLGVLAIKTAIEAAIGWIEGKWHDRKS